MKRTKYIDIKIQVEVELEMDDKDCKDMSEKHIEEGFITWREDFSKHIDDALSDFEQGYFKIRNIFAEVMKMED